MRLLEMQVSHGWQALGRIEGDRQRAESMSQSSMGFAALARHIAQWSGTTHWQKQVTGTSLSYLGDCYGTVQKGGLGGAPGVHCLRGVACCPPETQQATGSEYLGAKYWLQKHLLMVQTGLIWAMGNYQHGSVRPCLSTLKCPQETGCNN